MSEVSWVALGSVILTAVVGPMGLAVMNHLLGRRDRMLADTTITEKNRESRLLRARVRHLEAENRRLRLRQDRPRRRR